VELCCDGKEDGEDGAAVGGYLVDNSGISMRCCDCWCFSFCIADLLLGGCVLSAPQEAPEPLLESLSGAVGECAVVAEGGGGADAARETTRQVTSTLVILRTNNR